MRYCAIWGSYALYLTDAIGYTYLMPSADAISDLVGCLKKAKSVVVMTGAGASAESGIPTFRGQGGFWREHKPEDLATADAFERNPKFVWEWYMWRRGLVREAQPNNGHHALAAMEREFEVFTLVTQNVDGLHQRAGSQRVIELHGNILRSRCHACGEAAGDQSLDPGGQLTLCECGGLIRPDVVWFGELLQDRALQQAWDAAKGADVYFSVGTSSLVQPAAGLADLAKRYGAFLVEINSEPTEMSDRFDAVLRGPSGEILPMLCKELGLNLSGPTMVTN
jgi:NAD-dependent deacetylase